MATYVGLLGAVNVGDRGKGAMADPRHCLVDAGFDDVRTAEQWRRVVTGNPFPREAGADPSHLLALVAKWEPTPAAVVRSRPPATGRCTSRARTGSAGRG